MPALPQREVRVVEMEEWKPTPREELPELEEPEEEEEEDEEEEFPAEPEPRPTRREPGQDVFVRIDKFNSVKKTISEIEDKLEDIDELIKKIRETKLREEQELSSWEKDVMHIKSRLQSVAENIFEKVE